VSKPGLLSPAPSTLTREQNNENLTGGSLSYNTIVAGGDLQMVLQALQQIGETRVLQNPQIAVMDGEKASIEVVEDQPYKQVTLETGTTNVTGVTYLFKKVGIQLEVTPRINDDDVVSVDVKPEISSISEWYDGAPQMGTPVVKKSMAETTVMVKNGVTIIIGGLIRNEKSNNTVKIPLLGSIPLVGRFFRYDSDSSANKETVLFLTPRIMSGDQPLQRTAEMKKELKPLRSGVGAEKQLKPTR
jgi:general secretion pathway protein D